MDLVEQWAASGDLPTLARLLEEGTRGRLRTTFPLFGPERWASTMTGLPAAKHGIFEFAQRNEDGQFRQIPFGPEHGIRAEPVWKLLSDRGVACGLVDVPLAYPGDVPRGFLLQATIDAYAFARRPDDGWRRGMSTPPELHDRTVERFGRYDVDIHQVPRERYARVLQEQIDRQGTILAHVLAERDWRFALTRISAIAEVQHNCWADMDGRIPDSPHRDAILSVYRTLDQAIGRVLAALPDDTTVFVVSDCGGGPLRAGVQLNRWLESEGYLRLRPSRRPGGRVDRRRSAAFSVGVEGAISINLRGRDRRGSVPPRRYGDVVAEIGSKLLELRDPESGTPIVESVHTSEEIYGDGPYLDRVPDLLIRWYEDAYLPTELEHEPDTVLSAHRQIGKILPVTGGHRPVGTLIAKGPAIPAGAQVADASVFDLVPTWLDLLGQPIPLGLEGRPLFGAAAVGLRR